MFYISSKKDNTWGITCTDNGVERFFTEEELVILTKRDSIKVYGLDTSNNRAKCIELRPLEKGREVELRNRLNKWRNEHNPWNEYPVENYLAMLPISTIIRVDYTSFGENNIRHSGSMQIKKIDIDTWKMFDNNNINNNKTGDHQFGTRCLEQSYVYSSRVDGLWLI